MKNNKTFYGEEIFPTDKEDRLSSYKYSGSDHSLLYKYFYSPFAEFIVNNFIPPYVAWVNKTEYSYLTRLLSVGSLSITLPFSFLSFYMVLQYKVPFLRI